MIDEHALTPVAAERRLLQLDTAMTQAELQLRRARDVEVEAKHVYLGGGIDATLVSGGCPVGADRIAEQLAEHVFGWQVERHPASWLAPCRPQCKPGHRRYGKLGGSYCPAAGNYRNQEMVDLGADVVLAFQLNGSRGTQDCMDRARAAGLRVVPYPLPIWGEHDQPGP